MNLTAASQPADPDDDAREDRRRASALVSAWLEKPHKINTALNMHQYATFEPVPRPVQDTSSQVYGPRYLLEPASRRSLGSLGSQLREALYVSGGGGQPIRREQVVAECDAWIALRYLGPDCIFVWDFHQGRLGGGAGRPLLGLLGLCLHQHQPRQQQQLQPLPRWWRCQLA
jgi:hypothetical protein